METVYRLINEPQNFEIFKKYRDCVKNYIHDGNRMHANWDFFERFNEIFGCEEDVSQISDVLKWCAHYLKALSEAGEDETGLNEDERERLGDMFHVMTEITSDLDKMYY